MDDDLGVTSLHAALQVAIASPTQRDKSGRPPTVRVVCGPRQATSSLSTRPMDSKLATMYQAVGQAVLWSQIFETVFFHCNHLVGILRNEQAPLTPQGFKVPTRNLIKKLSAANQIAPELESQMNDLVEKRNQLIHEWFRVHGLPGEESSGEIGELTALANEVEQKSKSISAKLAGYVSRWGEMNPTELPSVSDAESQRLTAVFLSAHLGQPARGGL